MRSASSINARNALGGQTAKYKGKLPDIAEEALIQTNRKAQLFVLGRFGGYSFDLARATGNDRQPFFFRATAGTGATSGALA